eukprot:scaffold218336_cov33-Prasinocladus_malaysianus.AAC.1
MSTVSAPETGIITSGITWGEYAGKTVADIGGSQGAVMAAVKEAEPTIHAINFDLPEVISRVPGIDGVKMMGGDIFDSDTIPEADLYLMKHILHDWSDEASVRILENIHAASGPDAKLLLAEGIVAEPGAEDPLKKSLLSIDMMMMVCGGLERTKSEWEALLLEGGWALDEVTATDGPLCQ